MYIKDVHDLKKVFEDEELRKNSFKNIDQESNISQKGFFYLYDRASRGQKNQLKIKGLQFYLSYAMISEKMYVSPLTFSSISEYREIGYDTISSDDSRGTKRSEDATESIIKDSTSSVGPITSRNIEGRIVLLSKTTTFFNLDNN